MQWLQWLTWKPKPKVSMWLFFWHPNHWNNERQAPWYLYQPLVTSQFHHFSPLRQNKSRAFTKDPHKSTHHGVCMSLPLATRMPLEKHFCILGTNIETLRKLGIHWHLHSQMPTGTLGWDANASFKVNELCSLATNTSAKKPTDCLHGTLIQVISSWGTKSTNQDS